MVHHKEALRMFSTSIKIAYPWFEHNYGGTQRCQEKNEVLYFRCRATGSFSLPVFLNALSCSRSFVFSRKTSQQIHVQHGTSFISDLVAPCLANSTHPHAQDVLFLSLLLANENAAIPYGTSFFHKHWAMRVTQNDQGIEIQKLLLLRECVRAYAWWGPGLVDPRHLMTSKVWIVLFLDPVLFYVHAS